MRLKHLLCGVSALASASLLAGCGMNQMSTAMPDMASPAITGQAMGGQQPVVGATISVVQMGTAGYGSSGPILASTITDSNGNFSFAANAYTCPQSDTPVYLLGIGGNAGAGNNASAVEAAALGTCANAKNSFVIMNEVTTAATAVVFSHFFSTVLGGANGVNDRIGGPSSLSGANTAYSKGLVMGNNVTIPLIVNNSNGTANQSGTTATGTTYTVEAAKINTIANVLATCINSSGSTNSTEKTTPCGKLFNFTAPATGVRPSDTLQAAVQMALFPASKVSNIFNLAAAATNFFTPALSSAPNDWTIGVGFTTSSFGLGVDTGTTSTLDIDSSGRVWFPSNASGQIGAAYFDPVSTSFNGPFNSTSMVHPQEVAIDANAYAWYSDSGSATVPGYLTTAPMTTQTVSMQGTISNAVTVNANDTVNVGINNSSTNELANISANRSTYSVLSGVSFPFPVASLAGDVTNGYGVSTSNPPTTQTRDYYVMSNPPTTTVSQFATANANGGQIIYTGNDDIAIRSYAGNAADGLCIKSRSACSNFQGALHNAAQGLAIDGGKTLWVAESGDSGVLQVPASNIAGINGAVYLNSNGNNNAPNNEFLHDATNSGTGTAIAPAPFGIGIDVSGNVWVTNAGCNTTGCTPGAFTLTEIVGAGFPTINPVSAQITTGNLVGSRPTK